MVKSQRDCAACIAKKFKGTPSSKHLSLKFCAGINNYLKKEYFKDGGVGIRPSHVDMGKFVETLTDIKSSLKNHYPNAKVA